MNVMKTNHVLATLFASKTNWTFSNLISKLWTFIVLLQKILIKSAFEIFIVWLLEQNPND